MAAVLAAVCVAGAWAAVPAGAQRAGGAKPGTTRIPPGMDEADPAVTIAILPFGTEPVDLRGVAGLSPGVLSAGLARVSALQTFLDIGQGNRVFTSLYDREPPIVTRFRDRVPGWREIVRRADSPPAEIVPGLLASTLREAGAVIAADRLLATPAVIAADREGRVERTGPLACLTVRCVGVTVVPATVGSLPGLIGRLRGDDLLIAIERPPPPERDTLAIGIAGDPFDGNLTSETTRTEGLVLATDLAPTILERYGLPVPGEMSGEPITAEGEPDAEAVQERAERIKVVALRRGPVLLDNLIIWVVAALLAGAASRWRAAPLAFALLGLSCVYLPLILVAAAAIEPSELGERVLVGTGAPLLAAVTLALARGWAPLAIACAITVGAYALDMIAGSPLTARSVLGPNPALGVRFYGIGNELEAALAVLIPAGVGAALVAIGAGSRPRGRELSIGAFLAVGLVSGALFAAGRLGADVGAAIVFPAGAAVAALAVPGSLGRGRLIVGVIAAPFAGLALLAAADLILGGDAHLSRSVFEAGGADELADVAERRLRLSASSFNRGFDQPLFWFAVAAIVCAIGFRRRILSWLEAVPLARAGLAGGAAAAALGAVANDSGSIFVIIGTICLLACLSFAYSRSRA